MCVATPGRIRLSDLGTSTTTTAGIPSLTNSGSDPELVRCDELEDGPVEGLGLLPECRVPAGWDDDRACVPDSFLEKLHHRRRRVEISVSGHEQRARLDRLQRGEGDAAPGLRRVDGPGNLLPTAGGSGGLT